MNAHLLSTNQSQIIEKFLFRFCSILRTSLRWWTKQESSACRNKSQFTTCFISVTYKRNSKGPKIDPCGTPHSVFAVPEYLFLIFTRKLLSERYDWNHIIKWFENPRETIFLSRMQWFVVSKAFCKSMRIILVSRPELKPVNILLIWKWSICWMVLAKTWLIFIESVVIIPWFGRVLLSQ